MIILRRAAAGTVAFILALSIVAVGLELIARFVLPPFPKYAVWPPGTTTIYQPSELGTPGVTGAGVFRVNSLGMRSDEPPPDRKQTIYIFGGSTAAELFLDQEHTWAQQIQRKLNAVPDFPKAWVGNLSAPGTRRMRLSASLPAKAGVKWTTSCNSESILRELARETIAWHGAAANSNGNWAFFLSAVIGRFGPPVDSGGLPVCG